jgi:hypothetical protein
MGLFGVSQAVFDRLTDRVWKLLEENGELRGQALSLERQAESLRQAVDRERHLADRATEAHQKLINTIVEMKREGFINAPVGTMEKLDIDLADPIMDAIGARSDGNPGLERRLGRWALAEMRVKDADPQEIAQRILDGASPPPRDDDEP